MRTRMEGSVPENPEILDRFAVLGKEMMQERDDGYLSLAFIVLAHWGIESVYCFASLPSVVRNNMRAS